MNIYLKVVGKKGKRFTFPSLPEKITVKNDASYQSYNIISKGKVQFPKGTEPTTVKWEGVFFGPSKKKESIVKKKHYKKPSSCDNQLRKWLKKGTVLNLIVTETNINLDVTISSYDSTDTGGFGNKEYSIELVEYSGVKITKIKPKKKKKKKRKKKKRQANSSPKKNNSYTVVSGDTLWGISQRFYGTGTEWKKIYDANTGIIEETARQHGFANSDCGHWIWPGEQLSIPK